MKSTIILSAFIAIFAFVAAAEGQTIGFGVAPYSTSKDLVKARFPVTDINRTLKIYQLVRSTSSDEACFDTTDFSGARQVGSDVATLSIDLAANSYNLKWLADLATEDSCRILFVATGTGYSDGADFVMWQRNVGSTGLAEPSLKDGSDEFSEATTSTWRGPMQYKLVYNRAS